MTDPSPHHDTGNDAGAAIGREPAVASPAYPGAPRWVKVSGIVVLVLVLLVAIVLVVGGGNHGPGRHMPSGGAGGHTSSLSAGLQRR